MGKGKKKDDKKTKSEAPQEASTSSTSQAAPVLDVDLSGPERPQPMSPDPVVEEKQEEECEGLGLGTKSKKNKPKKKKGGKAAPPAEASTAEPTPPSGSGPSPSGPGPRPGGPGFPPTGFTPSQSGFPPPQGYPQAGFPRQHDRPPTDFLPPQGHPQTGFPPPQGHPSTGFPPPQGRPSTGFPPPQGHPSTGFPASQGRPSTGFPPSQGHPSTGFPPPQGHPSTGFPPPQGHPSTAYAPSGFPPQGFTPAGFPPPRGPAPASAPFVSGPRQGSAPWQSSPATQPFPQQQSQPNPQPMTTDSLPQSSSAFSSNEHSRGRGFGRGKPPVESKSVPMHLGTPTVTQQPAPVPTPSSQPTPTPVSREVVSSTPRPETVCRYKIPEKIIGRTVRAMSLKLLVNYLPMKFQPIKVYRYDVSFKPDRPKKLLKLVFTTLLKKYFPNEFIAFDQSKNCFSFRRLSSIPEDGRKDFTVEIADSNGKSMSFIVSFKQTGIVDLGKIKRHMETCGSSLQTPNEEIQCVDVILRQGALDSYVKCGRQFFKRPANPIILGGGLEMWTGLFQSAIFTSNAYINVDVAHKGFPICEDLITIIKTHFGLNLDRPLESQQSREIENFHNFMKRLRVEAQLLGTSQKREFIVNSIVGPPKQMSFKLMKNNTEMNMTVYDYFMHEKNYKLKYPNFNCAWVGPKEKLIYYPLELLTVSYGQLINKQLNEKQLSTMVREAATPPDVRKRKIEEVTRSMNYSGNAFFKKFGLEISDKFLEVDAKVLEPPSLKVGDNKTLVPRRGAWQFTKLLKPESLEAWGFVVVDSRFHPSAFEGIKNLLMDCGRQMGMRVSPPRMIEFNKRITDLRNIMGRASDDGLKFLIVVIPANSRDAYHKVKQMAEREVGIVTQCIKDNTISNRMNPQTMKNILLKLNSKMMGINQSIDSKSMPRCMASGGLMVVGADVTHPSPDQANIPSIAAVTASLDPACFMYNIELSVQTPKKEVIVDFEQMMFDHLKVYFQMNKTLPTKIYVFRDGVSEGQFAQVMNCELYAIQRAYERLTRKQKPEILFLLVQKRHHTRFFLGNNSANVEPGTCVDTQIVHPKELDFYLVSHQAIKGTARPTRYHAVCNDSKLPHDEVEQLTYYLCHLYSRCTRSVSYPTPTYYAHLACLRARSLTHGQTFDNKELEKAPQRLAVLEKILKQSRMFFV